MLEKMNHAAWGADWRRLIELPVDEQVQIAMTSRFGSELLSRFQAVERPAASRHHRWKARA
jgi:hypothetical protein